MRSILKKLSITVLALFITASGLVLAQQPTHVSDKNPADNPVAIPDAWPANIQIERLSDIGKHKAVIFSPDFAQPGNREFYEKLGFFYIQNANWSNAVNLIVA